MLESCSGDFARVLLRRYDCLRALIDQPLAKRDLVERLDTPRSTLDDIVRELERVGLVEYDDGLWQPTFVGQCACRVHARYLERLDDYRVTAPVLDPVPADSPLDPAFLDGVEVYEADLEVPDALTMTLLDHVACARRVRLATPIALVGFTERLHESVTARETCTFEMILPGQVIEGVRATRPGLIEELLDAPDETVYRAPLPFTFGLWIADDDHAGVAIFEKRGICGLLVNDTDDALAWASEQYDRVKGDAEPISSGQVV